MSKLRLTIAAKVYALTGAFLLLAGIVAIVLISQSSTQRKAAKTAFENRGLARTTQVVFKTQVQEWKNLLIRGHTREGFEKYATAFGETSKEVDVLSDSLQRVLTDSPDQGPGGPVPRRPQEHGREVRGRDGEVRRHGWHELQGR